VGELVVGEMMVTTNTGKVLTRSITTSLVPGLAATEVPGHAGSWVVTHVASGRRVNLGSGETPDDFHCGPWRAAMQRVVALKDKADWTLDLRALVDSTDLRVVARTHRIGFVKRSRVRARET
jgi:hypothetical protein